MNVPANADPYHSSPKQQARDIDRRCSLCADPGSLVNEGADNTARNGTTAAGNVPANADPYHSSPKQQARDIDRRCSLCADPGSLVNEGADNTARNGTTTTFLSS